MAQSSPPGKQSTPAALANARQMLDLLKSQLRANKVEKDYWLARLDDLSKTLESITEGQTSGDEQSRLAALYEVSRLIGSSLDLNEVLNQVMDAIIQLTSAERGFLMLFDERGELEVKAARNLAQETLQRDEFAISRSVIRAVADTGDQVVTTNAVEDPRFADQSSVVAHNLRSIQCVPLRARGTIIGVIYVDNRIQTGVFDENDLGMLSAFAAQAAVAIENARLFTLTDEALAARVGELSLLQQIDRELNDTLDFGKVMSLTLDWAIRMTQADNGVIGLIDLGEGTTRIVARQGDAPAIADELLAGKDVPQQGGSFTVPIQREGRVIGVVALDRDSDTPFSPKAHAFLLRLADHAAIAIENAQLYDAVKHANTAKTEFISAVTHELRIPMTSIKGYAEMIGMMGNLNEQQSGFLAIIQSNIQRMSVLVSDLSDIARIESGRLKLEIEEKVSLRHVLDDVLPTIQAEIEKRQHTVKVDMSGSLPTVSADPQRLAQILVNLISNAYKYTPNGGTITLSARKDGKFVRCDVRDTGIGMTPDQMKKLFTKFWRADDLHVREQPGTGLGLTIARNLVEMQGGAMVVESVKDKGSMFGFTLPVTSS